MGRLKGVRESNTNRPVLERLLEKSVWISGCLVYRPDAACERQRVTLTDGTRARIHVWSCESAWGLAPADKPNVLHSCDNPRCWKPDHLRWGTQAENVADMVSRGRHGSQKMQRNTP